MQAPNARGDSRGGAREQHRAFETRLAVLVRRRRTPSTSSSRRTPCGSGTARARSQSQSLASRSPMRIWSTWPIHSTLPPRASTICDDRVAVLAVLSAEPRPSARLELQQVEHHDRTLVGRVHELDELCLVRSDRAHRTAPFGECANACRSRIRRARATLQPCAVRKRFHASQLVTRSTASSVSASSAGKRRARAGARRTRSRRARLRGDRR